jgi:hypothetical protein
MTIASLNAWLSGLSGCQIYMVSLVGLASLLVTLGKAELALCNLFDRKSRK